MAAHGAGDIHAATALAKEIRRMRAEEPQIPASPPPITGGGPGQPPGVRVDPDAGFPDQAGQSIVPPIPPPPDGFESQQPRIDTGNPFVESALQGATLGFSDELQAGAAAGVDKIKSLFGGPEVDFGDRYDQFMQQLSVPRKEFQRERPGVDIGLNIAGALPTGGALIGAGGGIARLAGAGAMGGALAGAGSADPGERGSGAAVGGALGGATAGVLGAGGAALRKGFDAVSPSVDVAKRRVAEAMQKGGVTQAMARERLAQSPGSVLADVGGGVVQDQLETSAQFAGGARTDIADFLEGRVAGEFGRLKTKISSLLGVNKGALQTVDDLAASRKALAAPLYDAAYKVPIEVTDRMKELLTRPAVVRARKAAQRKLANEGIEASDGIIDTRSMDAVKRELDDRIGVARRAGRMDDARILTTMKKGIVAEVDAQNPIYAEARRAFSDSMEIEDALNLGRKILTVEGEVPARAVANMNDSQVEAYRVGAMQAIKNRMGQVEDQNGIARMFNKPNMREKLESIFPADTFDDFITLTMREIGFAKLRGKVLSGSPTARRLAGIGEAFGGALSTGGLLAGLLSGGRAIGRAASVPSERANKALAGVLLGRQVPNVSKLTGPALGLGRALSISAAAQPGLERSKERFR